MISQMLLSTMAVGALFIVPSVAPALVVLACAIGGVWALREQDAPASLATSQALERSKTVIGELDAPVHPWHVHSAWEVDA